MGMQTFKVVSRMMVVQEWDVQARDADSAERKVARLAEADGFELIEAESEEIKTILYNRDVIDGPYNSFSDFEVRYATRKCCEDWRNHSHQLNESRG